VWCRHCVVVVWWFCGCCCVVVVVAIVIIVVVLVVQRFKAVSIYDVCLCIFNYRSSRRKLLSNCTFKECVISFKDQTEQFTLQNAKMYFPEKLNSARLADGTKFN